MGSANQPGQLQPLIRTATPDDAPAIAHLLDVLGYACSDIEAGERIAALAEDLDQRLLVADLHGGVVGLICYDLMYYLPLGVRTCRITALSVSTDCQGRGIGRQLLREAETRAREAGAARIELTSAQHRVEAHAFYRACGYGESALRFLKRLGDA
ncbi:MAG TPA: GNAT family N-acetyltransferase [Arenimonas sp.]|uniref:GNAT family N-acetyltransferase n=1 Tax=Arenimonas sp. TaxID=1872635 RepID=UPI002C4DA0B4|nr:GNAT family N-acetyltransferase [Arenimonas sp.]HMB56076.1 GNAT family N-acetyltransferase [Arenimonas sp.]